MPSSITPTVNLEDLVKSYPELAIGGGTDPSALTELQTKYALRLQIADLALKERELSLKEASSRQGRWTNPLTVAIVVAAVGLLGNFVNGLWANLNQRAKMDQQRNIEKVKLENDLIKEAIRSPDEVSRAKSLVFFANNRLISLDPVVLISLRKTAGTDQPVPGSSTGIYLPVAGSLIASPDHIRPGELANLSWNSFNASRVTIMPDIGLVAGEGTRAVSPRATTTYTITMSNLSGGLGTATATVYVQQSQPLPPTKQSR